MRKAEQSVLPFTEHLLNAFPAERDRFSRMIDRIPNDFRGNAADALAAADSAERRAVEQALSVHRADLIRSIELFDSVPPAMIDKLAAESETLLVPADAVVFSQGSTGDRYFIIASGSAQVYHELEDGTPIILAGIDPGEGFGEMALLTGEPRSASVRVTEQSCLVSVQSDTFNRSVASFPEISQTFIKVLARRLSVSNASLLIAAETEHAFRQFLSESMSRHEPAFVGDSPAARKLRLAIGESAKNRGPVLISGEPGSELWDVAALIHGVGGMLLCMDARSIGAVEGMQQDKDSDALRRKASQETALFGRRQGALPFAPERRFGFLQTAGTVTVFIENIEVLEPEVQEKLAEYLITGMFLPIGEKRPIVSRARIIAATSADIEALVHAGAFSSRLCDLFMKQHLAVPPLRQRKRDLPEITAFLIERHSRAAAKQVRGIDEEAHKSIMAYSWPGNIEELNIVIRRGVNIARGDLLTVDDIFISPPPVTGKLTFNLLKLEPIRKFFQSSKFPVLPQVLIGPMFLMIIILGLYGPQSPDRNVALPLTWGIWEPMLFIGTFFVSRAWCSVCPIGAVTALAGRLSGLGRKVPNVIRNHGLLFSAAGVGLIYWAESAAGMISSPRATAILVISILSLALFFNFVFQKRTWCRYLCPLGNMVGTLSTCSMVELRANYGICNNQCTSHECFTGSETRRGCQLFSAPFSLRSNLSCVMCGNCIKTCPHNSPVLNLRMPGHELWSARSTDPSLVYLGIALMGTQIFRGMDTAGYIHAAGGSHALSGLVIIIAAILSSAFFIRSAGKALFGDDAEAPGWHLLAYAFLPLIGAFEAGYQLRHLLRLAGKTLMVAGQQLGLETPLPGFSVQNGFVIVLQLLLLLAGIVWSLILLRKYLTTRSGSRVSAKASITRSWPVFLIGTVYLILILVSARGG